MNSPIHSPPVAKHPSLWDIIWFAVRAKGLQAKRLLTDTAGGLTRLPVGSQAEFPFVIAESVSQLDTGSDPRERRLLLGKYQNLRSACHRINHRVLRAGETFSFWRQVGPPWKSRGFVMGREVREGCIIPTTGGGLCQLSGSLLEAALRLNCELIERHRHTALPADVPHDERRDATLFWNYVDLRFRAPRTVLIEAFLTEDSLIVRFRGESPRRVEVSPVSVAGRQDRTPPRRDIEGCYVCGKRECVRCQSFAETPGRHDTGKTAYLVDQYQPEFDAYIQGRRTAGDRMLLPVRVGRNRRGWNTSGFGSTKSFPWLRLRQSLALRRAVARRATVAQVHFEFGRLLAEHYASHIGYDIEHLCISQALLPHLWQRGVLGGRRFDVLMYREPLAWLERKLDAASHRHPDSGTLAEFRSPPGVAELEQEALDAASTIITPHAQIAALFNNVARLAWAPSGVPPNTLVGDTPRDIILFCGPTLARKGAHAVREAVRRMGFTLTVLGADLEGAQFWQGLPVVHGDQRTLCWERVYAVLEPALLAYWPRHLLRAHAAGAQLVISPECGIDENKPAGIHHVPFGEPDALVKVMKSLLRVEGHVSG